MQKGLAVIISSFVIGLLLGFFPTYSVQSNEINSLKNAERELSETNRKIEAELVGLRDIKDSSDLLEAELSRVLLASASGGGVNMKMMPHPETGELSVELPEVFSFDANHAFCRVDTNHEAFVMPTYQMGDVLMEKNEFFMAMSTTSIEEFNISKDSKGRNRVIMTGGLDCFTEVAKANIKMGSREIAEIADYKIEAVDGGIGGGKAGDSFKFTVYFDPKTAPTNYAIFGPEFTFTGEMIDGEITVPAPR